MTTPPSQWFSPENQPRPQPQPQQYYPPNPPQQYPAQQCGPAMPPPQWSQEGGYIPSAPIDPVLQMSVRTLWWQRRGVQLSLLGVVILIVILLVNSNKTFTFKGELTLYASGNTTVGSCNGTGGYSDLRQGASVTIYNSAGSIIGSGLLPEGQATGIGNCVWDFQIESIPAGSDFYQVEVTHRGRLTVSSQEATSGNFAASIGR
jgi:hypothetical protein